MRNEPALAFAWVRARSLARGLPDPVPAHGGLRVDTRSESEHARWVFAAPCPGLLELGQTITEPGYLLKLFASPSELMALLPSRWALLPQRWFMRKIESEGTFVDVPDNYTVQLTQAGRVSHVEVKTSDGGVVAEGYCAQTDEAFVYDRITTSNAHRRRGLGTVVIQTLGEHCSDPELPHLLVATEAGRALYEQRGWKVICSYATAGVASTA